MLERVLAFLRGGTIGFNKPELLLLDSVIGALPEEESDVLRKQVQSVSLVQRHDSGRLVAAYYPKRSSVPLLPYPGYEYCLAKVSYRLNETTRTTNVVLHDGKLMTLERNVPRRNERIDEIVNVSPHPGDYKPVAQEIDAEAHGGNA
ncbi:hypothetical protein G4Y73_00135 [Wenzhouxiangella sp. XN201]|uniref:hypothetical protein n=1 Tax=Wenzhouxiangella sp. XN201 TaxID=2710755 RepID=UPI0013C692E4|nr:hypothetical protein [Wenzhouxiangella sp. XN201]NEZ02551.1 hypothetical protein [Wenzhouxiangella sp. XN201]